MNVNVIIVALNTGQAIIEVVLSSDVKVLLLLLQLSFIEEYEDRSDLLVGEWQESTQDGLWTLADRCILKRNRRPTSSQVSGLYCFRAFRVAW